MRDAFAMENDKNNGCGLHVRTLKCKNAILRKRNNTLKTQKMSLLRRCREYKMEIAELRSRKKVQCEVSSVNCVHKELLDDALKEILQLKKSVTNLAPNNVEKISPKGTQNVEQISLENTLVNVVSNDVPVEFVDTEEITIELHDPPPQVVQVTTGTSEEGEIQFDRQSEHGVYNSYYKQNPQTYSSKKKKLPVVFPTATYVPVAKRKPNVPKHDEPKTFRCLVRGCNQEFKIAEALRRHSTSHSGVVPANDGSTEKRYYCAVDGCGLSYRRKHDLKMHMRLHTTKQTPYGCTIEGCTLRFSRIKELRTHVNAHINGSLSEWFFDTFGQRLTNTTEPKANVGDIIVEKPFKCSFAGCNLRFAGREDRRVHARTHVHSVDRPFKCSFTGCRRDFANESRLADHIRTHTEGKQYKCSVEGCDKMYSRPYSLEVHLRSHTGFYLHKCSVDGCKEGFSMKSQLKKHIQTHKKLTAVKVEQKDLPVPSAGENGTGDVVSEVCEDTTVNLAKITSDIVTNPPLSTDSNVPPSE